MERKRFETIFTLSFYGFSDFSRVFGHTLFIQFVFLISCFKYTSALIFSFLHVTLSRILEASFLFLMFSLFEDILIFSGTPVKTFQKRSTLFTCIPC